MAFHNVRFPLDIALGARGGPQRLTDVVSLASGAEERNTRWAKSRRKFDVGYGVKSRGDMEAVLAFFEERRGRFHSFLWRDGLDYSSANAGSMISSIDQSMGTGDGIKTEFQLQKRYGGDFDPYDRLISKPRVSSVVVALNGVEVLASNYSLDGLTGIVTFDVAPTALAIVSAGFEFDIPVRFESDFLDIELVSFDAVSAPHIPVIEVLE